MALLGTSFEAFDWDEANTAKCLRHGVDLVSIEQVLGGDPALFDDAEHAGEEARYKAIGITGEGRHVFVAFTLRGAMAASSQGPSAHATCTGGRSNAMRRPPLPTFHSDDEAERFVAEADLSDYDLSTGRLKILAFREPAAEQAAEIKLPRADLEAAARNARSEGVPLDAYLGRLVHESLERLAS